MMARQLLRRAAKACFDILLFVIVWFGVYAIQKWFEPNRRGFFCGDETLAYPYRHSTISILATAIIVLTVPTLVILVVELFKHLEIGNSSYAAAAAKRKSSSNVTAAPLTTTTATATMYETSSSSSYRLGYRLLQCYKYIGYYLFGLGLTFIATEILKRAVGRLRPHFLYVCVPQLLDGTTCDDDINQGRYIMDYICTGQKNATTSVQSIEAVNQSFPSGHSSLIFYAMMFVCIYLQAAMSTRASKLLKHLLQFVFILFAAYVAMTRLSDFMHHWSDVLAGSILGIIIAAAVTICMSDLYDEQRYMHGGGIRRAFYRYPKGNSSASSIAKSIIPGTAALPAYTFGTLPYLHYAAAPPPPPPHAQYSHATYQNYGYVP